MNDEYKEIVNDCLEHAKNQNGSSFDEKEIGDIVKHYNENHDPKTGRFAPKEGGSVSTNNRINQKNKSSNKVSGGSNPPNPPKNGSSGGGSNPPNPPKPPYVDPNDVKNITTNLANIVDPSVPKGKEIFGSYPELSNDEMDRIISRLQKEHTLSNLKGDTKEVLSGKQKAREIIEIVGSVAAIGLTVASIMGIITTKSKKG